jgi:alpha-tubulin suppressor-like RCC1 family protein
MSRSAIRLLTLATVGVLAACTDQQSPLGPTPPPVTPGGTPTALQALACTAQLAARTLSCVADQPSTGGAQPLIVGGQNTFVQLASSNLTVAGGLVTFNATVKNLIGQSLGVGADGAPDPAGVRVFFSQPPTPTSGTGTITVNGAQTASFLGADQLFYEYAEVLSPTETSAPKGWSFSVDPGVASFSFKVYVAAAVQYPEGWVEIDSPSAVQLESGGTRAFNAIVRNVLGQDITSQVGGVTWSATQPGVVTLNGGTATAATDVGYTTLVATSGGRRGSLIVSVGKAFTQVSSGFNHTCGLTPGGKVYCWGSGGSGQLGHGTYNSYTTPNAVQDNGSRFVQIAAASYYTCGLTDEGQAFCWGRNAEGQLGTNSTTYSPTPVPVQQGSLRFTQISAEYFSICAVANTGQAYCWGDNGGGQLGDGTLENRLAPVAVQQGGAQFVQVETSAEHTCARTAAGQEYCWGNNEYGQLGDADGITAPKITPVTVQQQGEIYAAITVGPYYSCAITPAGKGYCWGDNGYATLGFTGFYSRDRPTAVEQGAETYTAIDSDFVNTCALTARGQAFCWGYGDYGTNGNGSTGDARVPAAVLQGATRYAQVDVGGYSACGLTASGRVFCWGYNGSGQIGDGTKVNTTTPVAVMQ